MNLKSIFLVTLLSVLVFSCKNKPGQEIPIPVPEKPQTVVAQPVDETEKPTVTEEANEGIDEIDLSKFQLDDVYFEFDKAELTDGTRMALDRYADVLKANTKIQILIEGHCDERGTIEYNQALGERRAERVRNYLLDLGLAPERSSTVSYGKMQPVNPGHDEESWAQNRRAHFRLGIKN